MRQKAEQKIREAAAVIGGHNWYRLDKVRTLCGLHSKIFDKTILDMARVGTILLETGDTSQMSESEIAALVQKSGVVYMSFRFIDHPISPSTSEDRPMSPEPLIPNAVDSETVIGEIDIDRWEVFEYLCHVREGKTAVQKLQEMIDDYIQGIE